MGLAVSIQIVIQSMARTTADETRDLFLGPF